ncbi:VRK1 kinase, partial [Polypterus senegalus]
MIRRHLLSVRSVAPTFTTRAALYALRDRDITTPGARNKMPPKRKAPQKGKAPAKRKLAEEFSPGEVLTDTFKKQWKLGHPIGKGGFGMLYLAHENSPKPVGSDAPFVIKVEPSENGPLFSELKFYMRAAKSDLITNWVKSNKLKYLGVPKYWGSGLYDKGGKRYRFMVMDRFGTDLQRIFEENDRQFARKTVLQLGLRILDTLEYIHEHEYVHADIKASNLLLDYKNPNQVYLVDYGLAYRYSPDGVHKEYKEDPKRCHDGTIEFTSIDAHNGVYELIKYMQEVRSLGYNDKPSYQKLRNILLEGLKSFKAKDDDKLDFSVLSVNKISRSPKVKSSLMEDRWNRGKEGSFHRIGWPSTVSAVEWPNGEGSLMDEVSRTLI